MRIVKTLALTVKAFHRERQKLWALAKEPVYVPLSSRASSAASNASAHSQTSLYSVPIMPGFVAPITPAPKRPPRPATPFEPRDHRRSVSEPSTIYGTAGHSGPPSPVLSMDSGDYWQGENFP